MSDEDYQEGINIRRKVMGDKFVDKAMNNKQSFSMPVQDYIITH